MAMPYLFRKVARRYLFKIVARVTPAIDFVDFDHRHEVDDYTEPVQRYTAGLFYPICIGEVLVETYRIEHKLGDGRFSTVWLARDIQNEKDVALKIMINQDVEEGEDEYSMQKEIISTVQDTSNLVTYLATFSLRGYKGSNHRGF